MRTPPERPYSDAHKCWTGTHRPEGKASVRVPDDQIWGWFHALFHAPRQVPEGRVAHVSAWAAPSAAPSAHMPREGLSTGGQE